MVTLRECNKTNLCIDCDDKECFHAGDPMADCPKWLCDYAGSCETCSFIKEHQEQMRQMQEKAQIEKS